MSAPRQERPLSVVDNVKAVLWGFLGVRRHSDFQRDIGQLRPIPLLVTGMALGFLFVAVLMGIVFWVTA